MLYDSGLREQIDYRSKPEPSALPLAGNNRLDVWLSSCLGPRLFKLVLQDLGSFLAGQSRFLKAQLAELNVIATRHEHNGLPVGMKLQLPHHPLSVEVSVPPPFLPVQPVAVGRSHERNTEVTLRRFLCLDLWRLGAG